MFSHKKLKKTSVKRGNTFPQRRLTPGGQASSSLHRRAWTWTRSQKACRQVGGVQETPSATTKRETRKPNQPNQPTNRTFSFFSPKPLSALKKKKKKLHKNILRNQDCSFVLQRNSEAQQHSSGDPAPQELVRERTWSQVSLGLLLVCLTLYWGASRGPSLGT